MSDEIELSNRLDDATLDEEAVEVVADEGTRGQLTRDQSRERSGLQPKEGAVVVALKDNAWITKNCRGCPGVITDAGLANWVSAETICSTFVRLGPGRLGLSLKLKVPGGKSVIAVTVGKEAKKVSITGSELHLVDVGDFEIPLAGYFGIALQGVSRTGGYYGDVAEMQISGPAAAGAIYIPGDNSYFGRRGPSVHLNYEAPSGVKAEYAFNEVTIPEDNDVVGSYFMALGFDGGYFGMQVNGPKERRVLFSVWSLWNGDDPDEVPEDYKVRLNRRGKGVHVQDFGAEGTGAQSYLVYPWAAGVTYQYLTRAFPKDGATIHEAWFKPKNDKDWKLIASFTRPKKAQYLHGLYSFLENFSPETGFVTREGLYGNQWLRDVDKKWAELTVVKFTADNTARRRDRKDYAGGVASDGKSFFLKNCGFFDDFVDFDKKFYRKALKVHPDVDFENLP